ncbi:MAG: hypothetical protein ACOH2T_27300 [Pseudomonas sp.]
MTPVGSKKTPSTPLTKSIRSSNELFFEADRLSDAAYALLGEQPISAQTLQKFSELKKVAERKYFEARQNWLITEDKINR